MVFSNMGDDDIEIMSLNMLIWFWSRLMSLTSCLELRHIGQYIRLNTRNIIGNTNRNTSSTYEILISAFSYDITNQTQSLSLTVSA